MLQQFIVSVHGAAQLLVLKSAYIVVYDKVMPLAAVLSPRQCCMRNFSIVDSAYKPQPQNHPVLPNNETTSKI